MKRTLLVKSMASFAAVFFGTFLLLILSGKKTHAQSFCANEIVYWSEDFGTGTTPSSHPNILNSLTYQATGPLEDEGVYRIINNTHQKPEWHISDDHTPGDVNGKMLVVNGFAETFFRKGLTNANGYPAGSYSVSFFMMNVNTPGTCAPDPILPNIRIRAEYRDANNNWVEMNNSPFTTITIPQSATPSWIQLGAVFNLPTTGTFVVRRIRFTLTDNPDYGCGNDFAIDDIKLASCPAGGPLPVQFLNVNATKKGSGVAITWSTASEFNNKYFDIEKSVDGGYNWFRISTTPSKGNGNTVRNYNGVDVKPVAGANFYRIRQVDADGTSKYSATVVYKLNVDKTEASVIGNPFNARIELRLLSDRNQAVHARLFDNTGKQVIAQKVNVAKGATTQFIQTTHLNKGMYILKLVDEAGNIVLSEKLIKQ